MRNSGKFVGERRSGFRDKAEYERVKRQGDAAIKRWIRAQMLGCSVTCVLIGSATRVAVTVYVLVAIVKKRLKPDASLYTLFQVFSVTLFEKIPLSKGFFDSNYTSADYMNYNELNLLEN